MPKFLYHATRESNLPSIRRHGLQTRHYGSVHGGMDVHPPSPSLYLSRRANSDNLHSDLFGQGPVVVLKIDANHLDEDHLYPDDFIYDLVAEGDIFETPESIAAALSSPIDQAERILAEIEQADDEQLPIIMKPFWRWYLNWEHGGEVAYTADIPPEAIVGVKSFTVS